MEPTNWPLTGCGTDMKKAKIAHWPNNQCLSMYVSTDQVRTDVARINQLQPELLGPDMQAKDRRRDDIQPIPACASI